jgi:hypothetical protein
MHLTVGNLARVILFCTISSIIYLVCPLALEVMPTPLFLMISSMVGLLFWLYKLYSAPDFKSIYVSFSDFFKGKPPLIRGPVAAGFFLLFLPNCLIINSFSYFPVSKSLAFLSLSACIGVVYQLVISAPFDPAQSLGAVMIFFGPVLSFFPSFLMGCFEASFWVFFFPFIGILIASVLLGIAPFFNSLDPVYCFLAQLTSTFMSMLVCLVSQSFERMGECMRDAGWIPWVVSVVSGLVHLGYGADVRRRYVATDGFFAQDWFQLGGAIAGQFYGFLVFGEADLYSQLHFFIGIGGFLCMVIAFGVQIGFGWKSSSKLKQILIRDRRNYQEQVMVSEN